MHKYVFSVVTFLMFSSLGNVRIVITLKRKRYHSKGGEGGSGKKNLYVELIN